ncbi:MAG: hypothetical protein AMXMBFR47_43210 [Planctomycetota bacterium]
MKILNRYIARSFLGSYAILILLGVGLYILFDLMANMDEFTKNPDDSGTRVMWLMWDFYSHNIPLYYSQLGGPVMSFAAAYTLAMMLRKNEMVAMVAAGVRLHHFALPIIASACLLIAIWVVNREFVIPAFAEKIARTKEDVIGGRETGVACAFDDRNAILTASRFYPVEGRLGFVRIIAPDESGAPRYLIEADAAEWDAARGTWRLERGRRYSNLAQESRPGVDTVGSVNAPVPIDEYAFGLTPEQVVLRRGSQWGDLLSIRDLNVLRLSRHVPNRLAIEMSLHRRATEPIVQLVLLLLAIPFFLSRAPANVLAGGGKALLMSGVFFLFVFVSGSLVKDPGLAALFAWLPILVFGPWAAAQLANVKT